MAGNDRTSPWVRDLLLIPAIVGVVVAVVTYAIPRFAERGLELTYSLDGPAEVWTDVNQPFGRRAGAHEYRLRIRNSGDAPLKNIPIRLVLYPRLAGVLNITHVTTPRLEFGRISEETSMDADSTTVRFIYELLNPRNEDNITVTTSGDSNAEVFANPEGVTVTTESARLTWMLLGILATLSSMLAYGLKRGLVAYRDSKKAV